MFDYIVYRIFEYFNRKDKTLAVLRTINFIALLQGTFLVPLFIVVNIFTRINPQIFGADNRVKYYVGIPIAIILLAINNYIYKKKLKGEGLQRLRRKYHKENYTFSVWWIFLAPVFFVFIIPMIYGAINGTIHFPLFEK